MKTQQNLNVDIGADILFGDVGAVVFRIAGHWAAVVDLSGVGVAIVRRRR